MPECLGNYANGNVEGADTLAGAGILNFPNIYVQQTPALNAYHYSVHSSRFLRRVSSVVHKRFLSKLSICSSNQYWPIVIGDIYFCVLKECNFKIALKMHLPSRRTDLQQINIQNLTIISI